MLWVIICAIWANKGKLSHFSHFWGLIKSIGDSVFISEFSSILNKIIYNSSFHHTKNQVIIWSQGIHIEKKYSWDHKDPKVFHDRKVINDFRIKQEIKMNENQLTNNSFNVSLGGQDFTYLNVFFGSLASILRKSGNSVFMSPADKPMLSKSCKRCSATKQFPSGLKCRPSLTEKANSKKAPFS